MTPALNQYMNHCLQFSIFPRFNHFDRGEEGTVENCALIVSPKGKKKHSYIQSNNINERNITTIAVELL